MNRNFEVRHGAARAAGGQGGGEGGVGGGGFTFFSHLFHNSFCIFASEMGFLVRHGATRAAGGRGGGIHTLFHTFLRENAILGSSMGRRGRRGAGEGSEWDLFRIFLHVFRFFTFSFTFWSQVTFRFTFGFTYILQFESISIS